MKRSILVAYVLFMSACIFGMETKSKLSSSLTMFTAAQPGQKRMRQVGQEFRKRMRNHYLAFRDAEYKVAKSDQKVTMKELLLTYLETLEALTHLQYKAFTHDPNVHFPFVTTLIRYNNYRLTFEQELARASQKQYRNFIELFPNLVCRNASDALACYESIKQKTTEIKTILDKKSDLEAH